MKQLHSIVTEHGVVRHLAIATGGGSNRAFWTLCSLKYKEQSIIVVDRKYGIDQTRVCHNCMLARRNKDVDTILPQVDEAAAERGRALVDGGSIRPIEAKVYRVEGSIDTYTVTVPTDPDFASLCTCMAAKTHPEKMCKHQAAVFLVEAADMGMGG